MARRSSVVEQLRRKFPNENFRAVRNGFGWKWVSDNRTVRAYAAWSPRYDGDDGNYRTEYIDDKGNMLGAFGLIF